jgi:hypothetical protein
MKCRIKISNFWMRINKNKNKLDIFYWIWINCLNIEISVCDGLKFLNDNLLNDFKLFFEKIENWFLLII